jgi:hypothetical protein
MPRPPHPPTGPDGLPRARPLEEKVARAVALVAAAWFALAAGWEIAAPLLAGHYASSASVGIIAENMLRWDIAGPVWEYTAKRPTPEMYYCHHPWGIFWSTALAMKLVGRHDFVCRLVPFLLSAATPPLLYAIGRAIWRPLAGAAAAAAFVVLPITLSFASFNALEVPLMFWSLLAIWGLVRFTQTGRRLHLTAFVGGLALAVHADWPAYVLGGELLGFALFRGYIARAWFGPLQPVGRGLSEATRERRFAAAWILGAAAMASTLALYLLLFQRSGKLADLLASYTMRSHGNAAPLEKVLAARRYWIELAFTPIAVFLGKAGALIALARLVVLRREHEVVPLALLGMAVFQYVVFKQGADVHVFWPHTFAAYFAVVMGAIAASLAGALEAAWALRARRAGRAAAPGSAPALVALAAALLPLLAIARDGVPALRYAHETGGRFNEKGLLIQSDGDKTAFLRFLSRRLAKSARVEMHDSMKATWSQVWNLGGRLVSINRPPPKARPPAAYLADTRFLPDALQADVARSFQVTAVGPFWAVLGGASGPGPIEAHTITTREPSLFERYFTHGTEPVRKVVPDPYLTWELRTHFGQPAELPRAIPTSLDHRRIARNMAVEMGDTAGAEALLREIERELRPVGADFDDGSRIVGTTFHDGVQPVLTVFVLSAGSPGDVQLGVRSVVTERAALSTTMADPTDREIGAPLAIAPKRWRKGHLYAAPVAIAKRPGTEVFRVVYTTRGKGRVPVRTNGEPAVVVLTLR